ncbi:hypothetical protein ELH26_03890 [Rhizobium leguminosarum]|nr:hypothetical protein ELH26_03890 [Rhizobium leguminosarum]
MDLSERRHILEELMEGAAGAIRLSEEIDADGDQLLASACEHGLEGIIAKRRNSPYRSGRTGDWLKINCVRSDRFFVVGYEKSTAARGQIGSLLLSARKGDDLVYGLRARCLAATEHDGQDHSADASAAIHRR